MNVRWMAMIVLLANLSASVCLAEWTAIVEPDRVHIQLDEQSVADYVFRDPKILRPYLAHVRTAHGVQVTRHHPPQANDADDHADMHPGIWLGLGDVNGVDFWRNRGSIAHRRFLEEPADGPRELRFSNESELLGPDQMVLGTLVNRLIFQQHEEDWLVIWDATFSAGESPLIFGDQEEMGFGARLATPLIERNGGRIMNSAGQVTASATWGQAADWVDYSGSASGHPVGITLMASPRNFRTSWWHNRDYGLMVANPFGRAAMKQGERSEVVVKPGESLRLVFAACIHEGANYRAQNAFDTLVRNAN